MLTTKTHPFEKAGLGIAPFKYVGFEEKLHIVPGVVSKPGGSCQYCYTAIRNCYFIKSSDGKLSYVGSECIMKVGDRGIVKEVKKQIAEAAKAKLEARIDAAKSALETDEALQVKLAATPYVGPGPSKHMLERVTWMMKNAGTAGKFRVTKVIERALKDLT